MLTKTVTYTDEQILRIFLIMQTVCLLPFLITDLALIHNSFSECLLANFGERQKNPFGIFVLGEWVYMDGYIKLAVYTAVIFFNIIAAELACKRTLVVLCGWILRLFYLFDFGWTVAASVLFWQKNSGLPNPTYTYCENSPYKGYLFFLLIFTYIIIPINLFVCGFRSNKVSELEITLVSERRGTELVEKQKQETRQNRTKYLYKQYPIYAIVYQLMLNKYSTLCYPILAGIFGFAATAIGSHFFNLTHPYYYIAIGIALFILSNHLLYKLKFNSYHTNGSTITTILVFTAQVVSMAIYKREDIGWKWVVGVGLILWGTVLIQQGRSKQIGLSKQAEQGVGKKQ